MDNADDLEIFLRKPISNANDSECTSPLKDYLPQNPNGSILLTTRDERLGQRLADRHASMIVDRMSPQEAQDLLRNRQLELPKQSDLDDTRNLLEALEYLPLAISQAAAFISENRITLSEYLEILRASDSDLQDLLMKILETLEGIKKARTLSLKRGKYLSILLVSGSRVQLKSITYGGSRPTRHSKEPSAKPFGSKCGLHEGIRYPACVFAY